MNGNSYSVIEVDINEILPNRFQPRIQFDEEEILELSDSIKEHGVIQPIVVRAIGNKYEIIAGERRYKASVLAGKETVPVIVKNLNDKDSAEIALIENIQRKNLTPIEEALSYKKILDMGYLTQENLATKLGKSQSSVANKIRLLNLSDEVQESLLDNKISERHARSLLRLKSITDQNKMLEKILKERFTVRKTDEEIDKILNISNGEKEEKIEKNNDKGERNMNNEMNQIPTIAMPNNNGFDIFGSSNPIVQTNESSNIQLPTIQPIMPSAPEMPEIPSMPVAEPIIEMPQIGGMQFDGNGNVLSMGIPSAPAMPEIPSMPVSDPRVEMPQIGGMQFGNNSNAVSMGIPSAPAMPEIPSMPVSDPRVEMPQIGGMQFDNNGNVVSMGMPSAPAMPEIPSTPVQKMPNTIEEKLPQMAPIIDSIQSDNRGLFPSQNLINQPNEVSTMNNSISSQQPIIITDYNKQYDPVMPNIQNVVEPKVDFKEVVNIIRECSKKIEQYGYRIDLEEYDLSTLYQVVFKIEK